MIFLFICRADQKFKKYPNFGQEYLEHGQDDDITELISIARRINHFFLAHT